MKMSLSHLFPAQMSSVTLEADSQKMAAGYFLTFQSRKKIELINRSFDRFGNAEQWRRRG